jgi:5-methylcytosine-specific restriction protein A
MSRRRSPSSNWPSAVLPAAGTEPCCELCQRQVRSVSRHHLVPREEGGRHGPTVALCQPCHSTVHLLLTNRDLARRYATVEALRQAPELQKYLQWVRRSRVEHISNRRRKQ